MKEKNPRWEIAKPLVIALSMALGMVLGAKLFGDHEKASMGMVRQEKNNFAGEVLRYLESHYVDSIDLSYMNEKAIKAILEGLDPHTTYLSPLALSSVNKKMTGQYKGIGIEFLRLRDTLYVTRVMQGGPAEKAQLKVGDQLLAFDGVALSGLNEEEEEAWPYHLLFSASDTLQLRIQRQGEILSKTLVKEPIALKTVSISQALNDSIHYIKIESFNAETYREFMEALEGAVVENNIAHLIIDVRDNPGGYLDAVVKIVSQLFSEKGRMIVYTEGLGSGRKEYLTSGKNFFSIGTISVLVNEYSASASEILAGALQDNGRGKILGRNTYGKGLVQDQYPLSNGGAIRLTVARFYTPKGRSIQNKFEVDSKNYATGQSFKKQAKADDNLATTGAIQEAEEASGGIEPDVFIPKLPMETLNQDYFYEDYYDDFFALYAMQEKLGIQDLVKLRQWLEDLVISDSQGYSEDFVHWMTGPHALEFKQMMLREIAVHKFGEQKALAELWGMDPFVKAAVDLLL
jgi:carboxyl-terminal processing protease